MKTRVRSSGATSRSTSLRFEVSLTLRPYSVPTWYEKFNLAEKRKQRV